MSVIHEYTKGQGVCFIFKFGYWLLHVNPSLIFFFFFTNEKGKKIYGIFQQGSAMNTIQRQHKVFEEACNIDSKKNVNIFLCCLTFTHFMA